jgi:hypothetical protein
LGGKRDIKKGSNAGANVNKGQMAQVACTNAMHKDRHTFARMIGACPCWVIAVIRRDDQEIIGAKAG